MTELELIRFRLDTLENTVFTLSKEFTELSAFMAKVTRLARNSYRVLKLSQDAQNGTVNKEEYEQLQFDIMTQDLDDPE